MDQAVILNSVADDTLAVQSYYDTKAIEQNADTLAFFGPNATKNTLTDNYQSNPLQRDTIVYGLGFDATAAIIRQAPNIDPVHIANALKYGIVEFKVAGGSKTLFTHPLSQYLNTSVVPSMSALAETSIALQTTGNVRLAQPFRLRSNATFDLIVRLKSAAAFPTAAQWAAAGYANGVGLRATLQTVSVEEYQKMVADAKAVR